MLSLVRRNALMGVRVSVTRVEAPALVEISMSEMSKKRIAICAACPEYSFVGLCKKCGCMMAVKTHMVTAQCPLKKW
jgi:hypothetical protein